MSQSPAQLVWIPGFMGSADFFAPLQSELSTAFSHWWPEPFLESHFWSAGSFHEWVVLFQRWVNERLSTSGPRVLIGYSLGGRFALHVMNEFSDQWSQAFLFSAHPGLTNAKDRATREQFNQHWAGRFVAEPAEEVLRDWQRLSVFENTSFYQSAQVAGMPQGELAKALTLYSPSRHDFAPLDLLNHSTKLTWILGKQDSKYMQLYDEVFKQQLSDIEVHLVDGAGHRVPLDQPRAVAQILQAKISSLLASRDLG